MCKMTARKVICTILVMFCAILVTGCGESIGKSNASQEISSDISVEEVERLKTENEQLKQALKEMKEVNEYQTNLAQVKNLEGYSKDDLEELQDEFEKLILNPKKYEPEKIMPLFYYLCENTDVVKEIYDSGNETLAEAIIETHMYWSGEFGVIKDFIKTWTNATTSEDSQWNDMIYNKCVDAFHIFKYYPEDYQIAEENLPSNLFSKIVLIHEDCYEFPEGVTKADYPSFITKT